MQIQVRLMGGLRRHRPAGIDAAVFPLELGAEPTIAAVLMELGIAGDRPWLYFINDRRLTADHLVDQHLSPGDRLTIAPPIKGG